jgi:hypothetical protein
MIGAGPGIRSDIGVTRAEAVFWREATLQSPHVRGGSSIARRPAHTSGTRACVVFMYLYNIF